ncbi:MAG TPA: hypothetical protein VL200_06380 [Lacunisphaera sp.]|jgi:hypothetical protein|nr:hypothetical protein [Lacunisphaera sp.]
MTDIPPSITTKRRIKKFNPLQLGLMLGATYALISLVIVPFFLLFFFIGGVAAKAHGAPQAPFMFGFGAIFIVFLPVLYGVMGFIGGVIGAFIYNLVAKWIGGVEVEVE